MMRTVKATNTHGRPDMSFTDEEVGYLDPARTRKFRNVRAGSTRVALVVDDLPSVRPWSPRYLRIYGTAELVERRGQFGQAPYMRITPTISWSFNLEGRSFTHDRKVVPRRTVHHAAEPAGSPSTPPARPGGAESATEEIA